MSVSAVQPDTAARVAADSTPVQTLLLQVTNSRSPSNGVRVRATENRKVERVIAKGGATKNHLFTYITEMIFWVI